MIMYFSHPHPIPQIVSPQYYLSLRLSISCSCQEAALGVTIYMEGKQGGSRRQQGHIPLTMTAMSLLTLALGQPWTEKYWL